jgi:LysM repeat protein
MLYTVRPGDTLYRIAEQQLGNGARWTEIAQLNSLAEARLMIGQELKLPVTDSAIASGGQHGPIRMDAPQGNLPLEEQPASTIVGQVHFFVVADEVLPSTKVVRKVFVFDEAAMKRLGLTPTKIAGRVLNPGQFGFRATDPLSPVSVGRHAMGMKPSRFSSASTLAAGSPRMKGEPFWIDAGKARAAGVKIVDTEDILRDLERIKSKTTSPDTLARIERTRQFVMGDREVLLEGTIPATAVKGAMAMQLTRGFRVLGGVGLVLTAYDLGKSGVASYETGSIRPLASETGRQAGGWGGALAGARIGAAAGGLVGIETGPGAVLTAAGGAILFGAIGFFGADWLEKKFGM